jgi:hypothetical protein
MPRPILEIILPGEIIELLKFDSRNHNVLYLCTWILRIPLRGGCCIYRISLDWKIRSKRDPAEAALFCQRDGQYWSFQWVYPTGCALVGWRFLSSQVVETADFIFPTAGSYGFRAKKWSTVPRDHDHSCVDIRQAVLRSFQNMTCDLNRIHTTKKNRTWLSDVWKFVAKIILDHWIWLCLHLSDVVCSVGSIFFRLPPTVFLPVWGNLPYFMVYSIQECTK